MESAREVMVQDITGDALASPEQQAKYGLSHIHHLLLEEDDAATSDSLGELVAKTAELAAILKEDSPALSLNSTHLGTSSVLGEQLQNSITKGPFLLAHDHHGVEFSEQQPHWMNNLQLPRRLAVPPTPCISSKFLADWSSRTSQEGEERSADAIIAGYIHGLGRRREKDHRIMYALKPRMENAHKVSGIPEAHHGYVDLNGLLLKCVHAIGSNNTKAAKEILVKLKQHASPYGNGEQRVAYYFVEALEARLAGTGWHIYLGNVRQYRYSPAQIWKASWMYISSCPFAKAFCFFANQTILDAAKGASTLHIREHQLTGFQYPSLFKALAARPGGPPRVRLLGVNSPHYAMASSRLEEVHGRLAQTGREIAACAASYGVPFHFTGWAGTTGTLPYEGLISPIRSRDEVFVVVSLYPYLYVNDDLLHPPTKRSEIIKGIRSVNPEAYIQGFVSGSYNTPFFPSRFREALSYFGSQYDMLDTFIDRENEDRIVFESEILGKAVINTVACEETNVVDRVDKHKQWYAATTGAGMEQIPLNKAMKQEVQNILESWHKEYMVTEDLNYLLMGWKGRTLYGMGAWKG